MTENHHKQTEYQIYVDFKRLNFINGISYLLTGR